MALSLFPRFETPETSRRAEGAEQLREDLLRQLVDRQLLGPTRETLHEADIQNLAMRELPPGTMATLFLMYVAYMRIVVKQGRAPASKSTFYSVARQWRCCLRFRKKSDHAMCVECSRLKSLIRDATVRASA